MTVRSNIQTGEKVGRNGGLIIVAAGMEPLFLAGLRALVASIPALKSANVVQVPKVDCDAVSSCRPDMVVLDPCDIEDVANFVRGLNIRQSEVKLVAIASEATPERAQYCLRLGFHAFLPRNASEDAVAKSLVVASQGGSFIDRELVGAFLSANGHGAVELEKTNELLSPREFAVLKGVAQGQSSKQVALALNLSPKTIDTYRARGMAKLDLADRHALVRYALHRGWL